MDKYLYIRTSRTRDQYKAQSYHRHRRLSERTKLERKYAFQYIQRQLRKLIIAMKHSENFFVFCHIFCILPFTYCRHRICANASELFSGNWVFGSEISTGFHHCPTTFVNLQNGTFLPKLSYQIGNYHCPKFKSAHFAPHECHMLRLNESLQIIAHHMEVNYTISFVGDSLGGQSAIAFGCDLEWHQITAPNRVQFVDSRTLRNDLPCAKKCIEDAAYREEYKHKGPLPCLGCPDGQQRQFNTSSPNFWLNDIWPSSKIIVLNSGVWFNNMQFHTDDYEGEYDKTLQLMVPIFMDLMRKGIIIAWTAMPPIETYVNPRYEWDSFQYCKYSDTNHCDANVLFPALPRQVVFCAFPLSLSRDLALSTHKGRNERAKSILEPAGVVFVDAMEATRPRKRDDPAWSQDGLHWCNPGRTAAPSYINEAMFHMIAANYLRNMNHGVH